MPVVTLVIEGGRDTMRNLYYDLKAQIPIVVFAVRQSNSKLRVFN